MLKSLLALALLLPTPAIGQSAQRTSLFQWSNNTPTGVTANPLKVQECDGSGNCLSSLTAGLPVNEAINTAIAACRVTVGVTPTALRCGSSNLANRKKVFLFNNGGSAIFLGDANVLTTTGYPLPAPSGGLLSATGFSPLILDVGAGVTLYAISSNAGQDVRVFEGS